MNYAKKSLGQHWLNDPASLRAMVEAANLDGSQTVLEVGPGQGSLTQLLVKAAEQVIAVELDHKLARKLSGLVTADNLLVVEEDIRTYNLSTIPANYVVVANIPYYLTNYLLQLLFTASNSPASITLLIQKQVAERLAAAPGQMSILTISAQLWGVVELGKVVTADKFEPPPKVDSQIVHIYRHQEPIVSLERSDIFRVVKSGFSAKRKKLVNNLAGGLNMDKQFVSAQLKNIGLSDNSRAQELSLGQWEELVKAISPAIRQ